ncbi:MAG: DUF1338 domain-containing protein [Brevundimonas sp.]|uniref:2-oxoadipate dioxygenase/decarboxylase HglS n=1 Tax=Brevundimonas sp. TaxID=1871086 RepID=UPI000DB3F6F9|nr:VOC family protein [Brevundimonas sp.]PZT98212.1 MAG: DUF1338 domain-containing protein [Brevundimonas sp.]
MVGTGFLYRDEIRGRFSEALSRMYREEVPQYSVLMSLVASINADVLAADQDFERRLKSSGDLDRLSEERHGAIRVGTPAELAMIGRAFAVMGMFPVSYYNLAPAGVPVHSTAFRPIEIEALRRNPFRVFTSLLRLELIEDEALREEALVTLGRREIFNPETVELIQISEREGGLGPDQADRFVETLLDTFRWHMHATVSAPTHERLLKAHRLIADVVSFRGPHINHLTPRTLDIDAAQAAMSAQGLRPKDSIEGPPRRDCPILLRQTSFKALDEAIAFPSDGEWVLGSHTARFGEIEQRGAALTPAGRALYDQLLAARSAGQGRFAEFPDDWTALRRQELAWFRYRLVDTGSPPPDAIVGDLEALISAGYVAADPIVYEDFLPVSAAGIFHSNLGRAATASYVAADPAREAFEAALGRPVEDEMALYAMEQNQSLADVQRALARPGTSKPGFLREGRAR